MIPDQIAAVCHEANRRYCAERGDYSHKPWEDTPWSIKQSAIAGVVWTIENPDALLSMQHEQWRQYKIAEGWVYGAEKDIDNKTHPCLVSYEEMPPEQRVKDALFRGIVQALVKGE